MAKALTKALRLVCLVALLTLVAAVHEGECWGWFHVHAEPCVIINEVTGEQITFNATASWFVPPERVFCQTKALWLKPAPKWPVRLLLQCKRRYQTHWFGTDGSYRIGKYAKWVKVYDQNPMSRNPGGWYVVNGKAPITVGEITCE